MAAPVGNQNAVGNKGGGRKSAYQENADAAMNELNGKEYDGRKLMINEAREREPRSNHGGGDHGDHGGGGGGGGYNRGHRREY